MPDCNPLFGDFFTACGKDIDQVRRNHCDQKSATFKMGDNNYVIILSNKGAGPCTEKPYTGCWQCWPSACHTCLGRHKQGLEWGPYACEECKQAKQDMEREEATDPAADQVATWTLDLGTGSDSSTDMEVESVYAGNMDSPSSQHDSVYSSTTNSPAGDNQQREEEEVPPNLIPIAQLKLGTVQHDTISGLALAFDDEAIMQIGEYNMANLSPNTVVKELEQEIQGGPEIEIHGEEGGEPGKPEIPDIEGSPQPSSGVATPYDTTGSYLNATPTKDKPISKENSPACITLDSEEETTEKRDWQAQRKGEERKKEHPPLERIRDKKSWRERREEEYTRRTRRHLHNKDKRSKRRYKSGSAGRSPRMRAPYGGGHRQMHPSNGASTMPGRYERALIREANDARQRIKTAEEEIRQLKKQASKHQSDANRSNGRRRDSREEDRA